MTLPLLSQTGFNGAAGVAPGNLVPLTPLMPGRHYQNPLTENLNSGLYSTSCEDLAMANQFLDPQKIAELISGMPRSPSSTLDTPRMGSEFAPGFDIASLLASVFLAMFLM